MVLQLASEGAWVLYIPAQGEGILSDDIAGQSAGTALHNRYKYAIHAARSIIVRLTCEHFCSNHQLRFALLPAPSHWQLKVQLLMCRSYPNLHA